MELSLQQLATASGVVVTVLATQGSVPRGPGTRMVVFAQGELGTIGGGHLEFQAIAHARLLLSGQTEVTELRHQCNNKLVNEPVRAIDACPDADAPGCSHWDQANQLLTTPDFFRFSENNLVLPWTIS